MRRQATVPQPQLQLRRLPGMHQGVTQLTEVPYGGTGARKDSGWPGKPGRADASTLRGTALALYKDASSGLSDFHACCIVRCLQPWLAGQPTARRVDARLPSCPAAAAAAAPAAAIQSEANACLHCFPCHFFLPDRSFQSCHGAALPRGFLAVTPSGTSSRFGANSICHAI